MLTIKNLVKEYVPGKPVLRGISLDIEGRDITAIIGPSGTGKSTLIRCINRLVEPSAGEILFEGRDVVKLSGSELRAARSRIGMVFQEYNLVERLSVMENLLTGCLGKTSAMKAFLPIFSVPGRCWRSLASPVLPMRALIHSRAGSASASAFRAR
jgi:phosphonate transport system ATP-binding protein